MALTSSAALGVSELLGRADRREADWKVVKSIKIKKLKSEHQSHDEHKRLHVYKSQTEAGKSLGLISHILC